jgi:hypothetical protein
MRRAAQAGFAKAGDGMTIPGSGKKIFFLYAAAMLLWKERSEQK